MTNTRQLCYKYLMEDDTDGRRREGSVEHDGGALAR